MTQGHILVALFLCGGVFQEGWAAPLGEETPTATYSTTDDTPSADDISDSTTEVDMNAALAYLAQYKYIDIPDDNPGQVAALQQDPSEALRNLQHMAGINETGILDEPTKEVIKLPRCGVSDNTAGQKVRRRKRFTLDGSKWRHNHIRYRISRYSNDLPRNVIDQQIKQAFDIWAAYTPLVFTKVSSYAPADIDIRFTVYSHGDSFPFDGPGKTLAHAFFPRYGGDIHLDDSDKFTAETYGGVDILQVVAHEMGHSLGLSHSGVDTAIMAPFYRGYNPNLRLDSDDIEGIQLIYGRKNNPQTTTTTTTKRPTTRTTTRSTTTRRTTTRRTTSSTTTRPTTTTTTTTPRPRWPPGRPVTTRVPNYGRNTPAPATPAPATPSPPRPDNGVSSSMCHDGSFDAITQFEGKTWMFRGSEYAELDMDGIVRGYPQLISNKWQGLPANLDAALYWPATYYWAVVQGMYKRVVTGNARTYFFKGELIWRFDEGKGLRYGYPRRIGDEFPGLPGNLDAAFTWSGNSKTYFIKGSYYYRVSRWRQVDPGYPRPLSVWRGLPSSVDAAFQWLNRRTYFFSGPNYFRFNDFQFNIDNSFPRQSAIWWLGCPDSSTNYKIGNLEMDEDSDQFEEIDTVPGESDNEDTKANSEPKNEDNLSSNRGSTPEDDGTGGPRTGGQCSCQALSVIFYLLVIVLELTA